MSKHAYVNCSVLSNCRLDLRVNLRATHVNTSRVIRQAYLDVLMSCLPQDLNSAPTCTLCVLKPNTLDAYHRVDSKQARPSLQNVQTRKCAMLIHVPLDLDDPPALLNHVCRTRLASCGLVRLTQNGAKPVAALNKLFCDVSCHDSDGLGATSV
jgi:hypothetical protein